ncbi:Zinc/iron permease [Podospora conica]|nr:Zinc/iron permease [Schizothecium conicum]
MAHHPDAAARPFHRARADGDSSTDILKDILCHIDDDKGGKRVSPQVRISAIFVILFVSTSLTAFPIIARNQPRWRIPRFVYLFSRYFGAGVIIATAFIHLLDPAYESIGPISCVALTADWGKFPWPAAIALMSVMFVFLLDFGAEWWVENKYNFGHASEHDEPVETDLANPLAATDSRHDSVTTFRPRSQTQCSHQFLHSADQDIQAIPLVPRSTDHTFPHQLAAFLILESGVLFHSLIIGLNLGVTTSATDFFTLYPVIAFHQAFEGLGLGARLALIPFPANLAWMPWALCGAYGVATPVAMACGVLAGTGGDGMVSGVLDAVSAGILMYTGLVELLARDFLFNKERSREGRDILGMLGCLLLGTGVMALLGKWA